MSLQFKKNTPRDYSNLKVLFEDTSQTSPKFFRVSDVPQVLTKGKNLLRISAHPSNLVPNSQIIVDIKDANGDPIYFEVPDYLEQDKSRVISIWIYHDKDDFNTANGDATITIYGIARVDQNGKQVPSRYRGKHNVKWSTTINVDRDRENISPVIFKGDILPTISISESIEAYQNLPSTGTELELTTQTGGGARYIYKGRTPIVQLTDGSQFNQEMVEYSLQLGNFEIPATPETRFENPTNITSYTSSIKELIDSTTVILNTPFTTTFDDREDLTHTFTSIESADYSISYFETSSNIVTENQRSYANLTINNVNPISGYPNKLRFLIKSDGLPGDYELLNEVTVPFSSSLSVKIPIPSEHLEDPKRIKIQYLNSIGEISRTETITEPYKFEGGNTYIGGRKNLISGSMFISNALGSGIEMGGVSSGFIRSVGYEGITSASLGKGPGGFIIYSGSGNLQLGEDVLTGVGMQMVGDNDDRHLIFTTDNGGLLDVKTDKFFIGTTDTQFISGSDGNIEISSSLFHLDPQNNLLVIGADAVINADLTVNNLRTPALINGVQSTRANSSSSIDSDGFARFVSASIGGFEVSETQINSANDNLILKDSGQITGSNVLFSGGEIAGFEITNTQINSTNNNIILKASGQLTASDGFLFGNKGSEQYVQYSGGNLVVRGDLAVDQIFTPATIGGSPSNITNASSSITSDGFAKFVSASIGGWGITTGSIEGGNLIMKPEGILQTRDFASGLKGWKISSEGNGTAEFENVRIRGTLRTTTFEKESVNAVGGQLWVANSTTITGSVAIADTTMSVKNASGFSQGEILLIKKVDNTGFQTEYVLLNSASIDSDGSNEDETYGRIMVQRAYGSGSQGEFVGDLGSAAQSYEDGQVIVSTGKLNTGYIKMNANPNDVNTPYMDVVERTGSGLYDVALKVRLGDLSGLANSDYVFGNPNPGFGLATDNVFLQGGIIANTGSIGGINMDAGKLYTGVGTWGNANTGFYLDSESSMSLADKLTWDGSTLSIEGAITITGGNGATTTDLSDISSSFSSSLSNVSSSAATSLNNVSGSFSSSLSNVSGSIATSINEFANSIYIDFNESVGINSSLWYTSGSIATSGSYGGLLIKSDTGADVWDTLIYTQQQFYRKNSPTIEWDFVINSITGQPSMVGLKVDNGSVVIFNDLVYAVYFNGDKMIFRTYPNNGNETPNLTVAPGTYGRIRWTIKSAGGAYVQIFINGDFTTPALSFDYGSSGTEELFTLGAAFKDNGNDYGQAFLQLAAGGGSLSTGQIVSQQIVTDANNKIVKTQPTPSAGSGLYLGKEYLGYYDSSEWTAYISESGEFLFKKDDDNLISFGNNAFTLNVTDGATISGSSINLVTPKFFFGDITQYISGSDGNIEISSSNFHLKNNGDVVIGGGATIEQGAVFGVLPALPSNEKLKVYMPFEEGAGSKVFNHANESEPATITDDYVRVSGSNTAYGNSLYLTGGYIKFDSNNNSRIIIHDNNTQVSQSTSVWINTPSASLSTPQIIVEHEGSSNGQALFISNNMVYWSMYTNSGTQRAIVSCSIDNNTLTHIGSLFDSNNDVSKIYKNGILQQSISSIPIGGGDDMGIGGVAGSIRILSGSETNGQTGGTGDFRYYGMIDELRIYKEALTDANFLALYQNPGGVSSTTKITGDNISTGQIKSNNWGTSAGSKLDLDNGIIKLGGSTAPKFAVNAAGALTSSAGTIGGITIEDNKLFTGVGTWGNSNTGFYVDSESSMSLADKLTWDGSTLNITGVINIESGSGFATQADINTATGSLSSSIATSINEFANSIYIDFNESLGLDSDRWSTIGTITVSGSSDGISLSRTGGTNWSALAYTNQKFYRKNAPVIELDLKHEASSGGNMYGIVDGPNATPTLSQVKYALYIINNNLYIRNYANNGAEDSISIPYGTYVRARWTIKPSGGALLDIFFNGNLDTPVLSFDYASGTETEFNIGSIILNSSYSTKMLQLAAGGGSLSTGQIVSQKIVTDINNKITKPNPAPSDAGLFLASSHMGYYDSSAWNAYISSSGEFLFKADDDNLISFGNSSFVLKVSDQAVISGSQISLLTPNFFFGGETQFISGANSNIEISSSNFHLQPNGDVIIGGGATIAGDILAGAGGVLPTNENLKIYLNFEEATGTTAFNMANTSQDFTINSTSYERVSGSAAIAAGNALYLDGSYLTADSGDFASTIIHDGDSMVSQSINLWLRPIDASTSTPQVVYEQDGATNGHVLYIANNNIYWSIFRSSAATSADRAVVSCSIDNTRTAIGVYLDYENDEIAIYKNGLLQQSLTKAGLNPIGADPIGIGAVSGTSRVGVLHDNAGTSATTGQNPFNGYIDEVRVYKRILTDDEFNGLYKTPAGSPSTTKITGDNISTGQIKSNNLSTTQGTLIDLNGEVLKIGGTSVTPTSGEGIVLDGSVTGQPKFFVGDASEAFVRFGETAGKLEVSSSNFHLSEAGDVTLSGTVTAEAGEIGGFSITPTAISSSNNELILRSNGQITGSNMLLETPNFTVIDTANRIIDGKNVARQLWFSDSVYTDSVRGAAASYGDSPGGWVEVGDVPFVWLAGETNLFLDGIARITTAPTSGQLYGNVRIVMYTLNVSSITGSLTSIGSSGDTWEVSGYGPDFDGRVAASRTNASHNATHTTLYWEPGPAQLSDIEGNLVRAKIQIALGQISGTSGGGNFEFGFPTLYIGRSGPKSELTEFPEAPEILGPP